MSHLLPSADRNTHIKIVAVALAVVAVVAVGLHARTTPDDPAAARINAEGPVFKPGKPTSFTSTERATAN
jgi:hypothetical protein